MTKIRVEAWRDDATGPMQVISGAYGREKVHYTAPPAERITQEMSVFLDWFNQPPTIDPVLKAAQAHLWFVTLHPFDDGNGRIARAIADMALKKLRRKRPLKTNRLTRKLGTCDYERNPLRKVRRDSWETSRTNSRGGLEMMVG